MAARNRRSGSRSVLFAGLVVLISAGARADSRVLEGRPVSIPKAQGWCISAGDDIPSWDAPAHPECKMAWKVLAERNGRILYSARYAWPSPRRGGESWRVLTEVLFEGAKGSKVVRSVYAVQEDESRVLLAPLTIVDMGDDTILETRVCMSGTTECGGEFASWNASGIEKIDDHTVAEIRSQLPKGFDLSTNPELDLASLSGRAKASTRGDEECCPSGMIEFKLRLDGTELHVEDMQFRRER
jgi:hypothetical protein